MIQDIFEKKIDQACKNCRGFERIVDDVQVFGNARQHMTELNEEMEGTRKEGITHCFDKCFIKTKCCNVQNGVKPDLKKEEASIQIQIPRNKQ